MDRFSWSTDALNPNEGTVFVQTGVKLYDGNEKTSFLSGTMILTSHRLIWKDQTIKTTIFSLPLSLVTSTKEEAASFRRSAKIQVFLQPIEYSEKAPGPVASSSFSFVQLSFTMGGQKDFYKHLKESLNAKKWVDILTVVNSSKGQKKLHAGISGIEKNIQIKKEEVNTNISVAFEDLSNLMYKAKEMVNLSKTISSKLKEKQGGITDDETIQLQSYLLSLGISEPITRESHGSGDSYFKGVARQTSEFIENILKECGGAMTLTDVYCRINRARGLELLSPEDLTNACLLLDQMRLPVRLKLCENGVKILQLQELDEEKIAKETKDLIKEKDCLSAEELARIIGLSVLLAKQRLLTAETMGHICRDESSEGLKFYPNLILNKT